MSARRIGALRKHVRNPWTKTPEILSAWSLLERRPMTLRTVVGLGMMMLAACTLVACSGDHLEDVAGPPTDAGPRGDGGAAGLPCDVAAVLARCVSCHGTTPSVGSPMSLLTYEDLVAPAPTMPSVSVIALSVTRMQDTVAPMPPGTTPTASAADIATLQAWINAGTPRGTCSGPTDPYNTPVMCSSGTMWTRGNHGSQSMRPGMACISCHTQTGQQFEIPFTIAGTVYPSAHEPDNCNGSSGSSGVTVEIVGADGRSQTITPNGVGNFFSESSVALPLTAVVHYQGRTRAMTTAVPSGDCNTCHTESGTTNAPGRIMLP